MSPRSAFGAALRKGEERRGEGAGLGWAGRRDLAGPAARAGRAGQAATVNGRNGRRRRARG